MYSCVSDIVYMYNDNKKKCILLCLLVELHTDIRCSNTREQLVCLHQHCYRNHSNLLDNLTNIHRSINYKLQSLEAIFLMYTDHKTSLN